MIGVSLSGALLLGIYEGFIDWRKWDGVPERVADRARENESVPMLKAGYVLGALIRVAVVCVLLWQGVQLL